MSRFKRNRARRGTGPDEADCYYCVGVPWDKRGGGHSPIEGSDGAGRWIDEVTGNYICTPHKNRIESELRRVEEADDGV